MLKTAHLPLKNLPVIILLLSLTACTAKHGPPVSASWEAPELPDTPAGKQVAYYLEAFNSGSDATLTTFVRQNFTPKGPGGSNLEARIGSQRSLYNTSRGLDVLSCEQANDTELVIVARLRLTEQWRQMAFEFDGSSPPRISGIRIVPIDAPPIDTTRQQSWEDDLEQYMVRLVAADQFSGVVLIARHDKPTFAKAYGLADRSRGIANTLETPFHYASVGKMFTAIAIGQLVEAGKLDFADTVSECLPDYESEFASQITVDQLLMHHSGIPDFFEEHERFEHVRNSKNPQRDYLHVFADLPLRFTPGSQFEYSNSNYILLGAIVEQISGISYEDYLDNHIFSTARMTSTTLYPGGRSDLTPAIGYTELSPEGKMTPGNRRPSERFSTDRGSAAGGGITTCQDMLNFMEALRNNQLVSAEMKSILLTERTAGHRPGEQYAYGFITRTTGDERVVGHSGGFPGVDAQVDMYLDGGWTVVVLANYEGVGEPVARRMQTLLETTKLISFNREELNIAK